MIAKIESISGVIIRNDNESDRKRKEKEAQQRNKKNKHNNFQNELKKATEKYSTSMIDIKA